jgi:hypothetical protein
MDDEDVQRYDGSASFSPDMVPLAQVQDVLGMDRDQLTSAVQAGQVLTFRLRDGKQWRWYVQLLEQPPSSSIP